MMALIDGDIVAYRTAWTTENDNEAIAKFRTDDMLDGILLDTQATEFAIYISDRAENNFRYKIYPEYKANRIKQPRPKHLEAIKEYLITKWSASIALGQEADDALGIAQDKNSYPMGQYLSIICSIDKDLQQIPGNHYNFVKKEFNEVTPEEGINYFYKQILIGDTADNIGGCKGIGPIKAEKILGPLGANVEALARAVVYEYLKAFKIDSMDTKAIKEIIEYITKVGQVLKIRQIEEEPLWHFPLENLTAESKSLSIQPKQEVNGPSMEPITWEKENGAQSPGEKMEESLKTT